MHNNYHFLKRLVPALSKRLEGFEPVTCFTQSKDELVMGFASESEEFWLRALLSPDFTCLSFPEDYSRARRNSTELFKPLIGLKVKNCSFFLNERFVALHFENDFTLVFKLFGTLSNAILFEGDEVIDLFKSKFGDDNELRLSELNRPLAQDLESFREKGIGGCFPTLGKALRQKLDLSAEPEILYREILDLLSETEQSKFHITTEKELPALRFFPGESPLNTHDDPVKALTDFYHRYSRVYYLTRERQEARQLLEKQLRQTKNYIRKSERKLQTLEEEQRYMEIGHILMANLHDVPEGATEVELHDFYKDRPIQIKLKRKLSPQKNAEQYYRKAKNQKIELEKLRENIEEKEELQLETETHLEEIEQFERVRDLRKYLKEHQIKTAKQSSKNEKLPFKTVDYDGFVILIGKNAKNNDLLTQKYAYKQDLWLHARDVSGSHTVIRYKPGKPFPPHVIERAAELAAYYSKRKTDSLCPVIVTPKKYVRKPKGSPPGAVLIDKEEVIMVKPKAIG